jgi:hypothetical protein
VAIRNDDQPELHHKVHGSIVSNEDPPLWTVLIGEDSDTVVRYESLATAWLCSCAV